MKREELLLYLRLVLPWLLALITSFKCPMVEDDDTDVVRPPPWVFVVVWSFLYVVIGMAWMFNAAARVPHTDVIFGLNALLLAAWLVLYNCYGFRKYALYVMICLVALALCTVIVTQNTVLKLLLCLYVAWMGFALHLSIRAIE